MILSDYYTIFIVDAPLCEIQGELSDALIDIENPFHLDFIEFKGWSGHHLHIHAKIFLTEESIELIYDSMTKSIKEMKK